MVAERTARARYAITLTTLNWVKENSSSNTLPNTSPDCFTSRQCNRSTTEEREKNMKKCDQNMNHVSSSVRLFTNFTEKLQHEPDWSASHLKHEI